jgi:hypothetical protein
MDAGRPGDGRWYRAQDVRLTRFWHLVRPVSSTNYTSHIDFDVGNDSVGGVCPAAIADCIYNTAGA